MNRKMKPRLTWLEFSKQEIAAESDDRLIFDEAFFAAGAARNPQWPADNRYLILLRLIREEMQRRGLTAPTSPPPSPPPASDHPPTQRAG